MATEYNQLLIPIVALISLSTIMWMWMYATRIPAILKMRMKLDSEAPRGQQMGQLPASVRWKADNYNNLMEQPTVFYALLIVLVFLKDTSMLTLVLAWSYVALRVVHSLIHATINHIPARFACFFLSGIVLAVLTVRTIELLYLS